MELRKLSLKNNESIQIRIDLETAVSITAKDGALEIEGPFNGGSKKARVSPYGFYFVDEN